MKKPSIYLSFLVMLAVSACSKNEYVDPGTTPVVTVPANTNTVEISGDIAANTTWTANKIYSLKGFVYVTNGATLTIEPGTIIKGDKASKATLVITRGAKINAAGTVDKPIVFTSGVAAGGRSSGDWGGIIMLGKAPINAAGGFASIEGGLDAKGDAAKYIQYGGTDANDNSGTLKYVRIEYGGIPFAPDNEINGLTLGGVGAGTTIDYVEVYRSGDDSFEWFGGTVNAKHLLSIGAVDDDFDTDFGFSGKVQFGLVQRAQVVADVSGSNGFESDNDATGSNNTPQTSAVFSNMTVIGPILTAVAPGGSLSNVNANYQHAAQIRRNSSISILNSIFGNYTEGVYFDDGTVVTAKATSANFLADKSVFSNNLIYNCNVRSNEVKGQNKADFLAKITAANIFSSASVADLLTTPFNFGIDFKAAGAANSGTPDFTVKAGSAAATGADFTNSKLADAFFEKTGTFKGAFGTTNWTASWASFDPQNIAYTTPGVVR